MGEGEDQLQKEWREIVMRELESLKSISSETRELILKADLQKIVDHESRIRLLEQAHGRLQEVPQLRREVGALRECVDRLKGWKNKSTGVLIGVQLVILALWALLVNFGGKLFK